MVFPCTGCGKQISANAAICQYCNKLVDPEVASAKAMVSCPDCNGRGDHTYTCDRYGGTGYVTCHSCRGHGTINGRTCEICDGARKYPCIIPCLDGVITECCETCGCDGYLSKADYDQLVERRRSGRQQAEITKIKQDGLQTITQLAAAAPNYAEISNEELHSALGVNVTIESEVSTQQVETMRSHSTMSNWITNLFSKVFKK